MTISTMIDMLVRMRDKVGDCNVLFDCPACKCAFDAECLETEPLHVRIRPKAQPSAVKET